MQFKLVFYKKVTALILTGIVENNALLYRIILVVRESLEESLFVCL